MGPCFMGLFTNRTILCSGDIKDKNGIIAWLDEFSFFAPEQGSGDLENIEENL